MKYISNSVTLPCTLSHNIRYKSAPSQHCLTHGVSEPLWEKATLHPSAWMSMMHWYIEISNDFHGDLLNELQYYLVFALYEHVLFTSVLL
jgi:hypothetical protein